MGPSYSPSPPPEGVRAVGARAGAQGGLRKEECKVSSGCSRLDRRLFPPCGSDKNGFRQHSETPAGRAGTRRVIGARGGVPFKWYARLRITAPISSLMSRRPLRWALSSI
jgi:hypothetical protein